MIVNMILMLDFSLCYDGSIVSLHIKELYLYIRVKIINKELDGFKMSP